MASKVDVVVPTLNCAKELVTLLQSLDQSQPPPHCVWIMDGGSTDPTIQIARDFGARVHHRSDVVKSDPGAKGPTGYAACKNAAVPLVDVPFVLFLDSDMEVGRSVLDEVERELLSGVDMVNVPEASSGHTIVARARAWERGVPGASLVHEIPRGFRLQVFADLGGYRTDMSGLEDIELAFRARAKHLVETRTVSPIVHHEERSSVTNYLRKRIRYASGAGVLTNLHHDSLTTGPALIASARGYLCQLRAKGALGLFIVAVSLRIIEITFVSAYSHQRVRI